MIVDISRTPKSAFNIGDKIVRGRVYTFDCDEEVAKLLIERLREINNLHVSKDNMPSSMETIRKMIE